MEFVNMGLGNSLLNALEDLGMKEATPIQEQAYPVVKSGKDVVGIAQTGTGKTFAYLLPVLRHLKYVEQNHPRVLIMVPTRELVVQVKQEIEKLTKYMNIRVYGVFGGVNMNTQKAELMSGTDIIVATPGRLRDLVLSRGLRLKDVRQVIIDEVDEMFNLGFRPQLTNIMELLPHRRQHILFSATMTPEVRVFIDDNFNFPTTVRVARSGAIAEHIQQYVFKVPNFNTKLPLLEHLLEEFSADEKILVFAETKKIVDEIYEHLTMKFGDAVAAIHSNKSQNYRIRTVEQFDKGEHRILVATDLIARGLDFDRINFVINFDTPDEPENYVHRIGRTGRAQQSGTAITLVNKVKVTEEIMQWDAIENLTGHSTEELVVPDFIPVSVDLRAFEIKTYKQKNITMKSRHPEEIGGGAFHEKKAKNQKVNLAQERRLARKEEKRNSRRRKKQ